MIYKDHRRVSEWGSNKSVEESCVIFETTMYYFIHPTNYFLAGDWLSWFFRFLFEIS